MTVHMVSALQPRHLWINSPTAQGCPGCPLECRPLWAAPGALGNGSEPTDAASLTLSTGLLQEAEYELMSHREMQTRCRIHFFSLSTCPQRGATVLLLREVNGPRALGTLQGKTACGRSVKSNLADTGAGEIPSLRSL